MKDREILYSSGNMDEYYTPAYAVLPVLKYIKRGDVVWCPFDTQNSEFVKLISLTNDVVFGDERFLDYEPKRFDVIISNPPFTNKRHTFARALSFNKPFALLMTNTWLNDSAPKQLFKEKDLQLLMFDKRIHFIKPDGTVNKKTTFSSSYFCWNFLPKQIIMEYL